MTSMPASRSARAMIFAPRSCPSRPGLATTTRILRFEPAAAMGVILARAAGRTGERAYLTTSFIFCTSPPCTLQMIVYVPRLRSFFV